MIGEISPKTGKITEYNIPTSNCLPLGITTDQNNEIWFTESASSKIGYVRK